MVHCLRSRLRTRVLVKGHSEPESNHITVPLLSDIEYLQNFDPSLVDTLQKLHNEFLNEDFHHNHVQIQIDGHLPYAALIFQNHSLLTKIPKEMHYSSFVLNAKDVLHLDTLPDIGEWIRVCLTHGLWNASQLGLFLHDCFPCPKPLLRVKRVEQDHTVPIIINIVFASVMGIYPKSVKKPSFHLRVQWFIRFHNLLTSSWAHMNEWIKSNEAICSFCVCEYVSKLLPVFWPCEYEIVTHVFPVAPFFKETVYFFDMFRQQIMEAVDCQDQPDEVLWEKINQKAKDLYEKMHRVYKSKCRYKFFLQKKMQVNLSNVFKITQEEIVEQLKHPFIRMYPIHQQYSKQLITEYKNLDCHIGEFCLSQFVQISPLPINVEDMQMKILATQMNQCEKSAYMRRMLFICIFCEFHNRSSSLRLSVLTGDLICEHCNSGKCVLAINAVGRVIRIHQKQFIYSLCCGKVVLYVGRFPHWNTFLTRKQSECEKLFSICNAENLAHCITQYDYVCDHCTLKTPNTKKILCSYCEQNVAQECFEFVSIKTYQLQKFYVCQKHTPSPMWLKYITYYEEFYDTLVLWEKNQLLKKHARLTCSKRNLACVEDN